MHKHASILPNALNQRVGSGSVATLQKWSDKLADMVLAPSVAGLFKWRQFEPEVILLAVGCYLRFSLSYRDVEEPERGLRVDHVTVFARWLSLLYTKRWNSSRFEARPGRLVRHKHRTM